MYSFFVGNKSKPSFLVEVIPKNKVMTIYKPDKYSKNEEFYEKYALGKVLITTKYNDIIFLQKPVPYKSHKKHLFVPGIIFKIEKKNLLVSKTIEKNYIL
jgi:DNA-directed RNA polymerase beta' subunit